MSHQQLPAHEVVSLDQQTCCSSYLLTPVSTMPRIK